MSSALQPRRGTGAPPRTRSHYVQLGSENALRPALAEQGQNSVDQPHLYGRSPRNRISELRRDGFVISGQARGSSDWHYVLLPDSSDWYEQATGKPRPAPSSEPSAALPLFDAVRP